MKFELPPTIYSPQQVEALIARLQFFMAQVRQQAVKRMIKASGVSTITQTLDGELQDVIVRWHGSGEMTVVTLEELAHYLQKMLKTTTVIHVILPEAPSLQLKQQFVTWLRTNLRPDLLVAFGLDRSLAGGFVLRTTNHIYDYSFRRALLAKSQELPAVVAKALAGDTEKMTVGV